MRKTTLYAALGVACLGLGALPGHASAQRKIRCDSQVDRRTQCEADTRGGVYLHEQKSSAPCLYDRTWGYTPTAVWVANGCRGEFMVDIPPVGSGSSPISPADAMRICRNTVAARLTIPDPTVVRVDIYPPDDQAGRSVGWTTSNGYAGSCRVSATGEVTGWTIRNPQ
jgi:hypothetical protein